MSPDIAFGHGQAPWNVIPPGGDLDWFSDFRNALGDTDSALLDGGKWTGYVSTPDRYLGGVISASGLGFPTGMSRLFQYEIPNADPEPAIQPKTEGLWTIPAVGEYQFMRFYVRCDFPDGHNPADQHFVHIGDDQGAASYESCYFLNGVEGGAGGGVLGGAYRIQFMPNWQSVATSETAWYNIYLDSTETYRIELRQYREATNRVRYASRVYDSLGNLRDTAGRDQQVWFEYYGAQGWTDLPDFVLDITAGTADRHFGVIECGYNGSDPQGIFSPTPYVHIGGFAVRVTSDPDGWIGGFPVIGVED